jgi:hypothetical protein
MINMSNLGMSALPLRFLTPFPRRFSRGAVFQSGGLCDSETALGLLTEAINLPFPSWGIRMGLNKAAVSDKVGEGESLRKPSAAERARFLSACREESGARTGREFFTLGKMRVFRRDSPEPLRRLDKDGLHRRKSIPWKTTQSAKSIKT